MFIAQTARALAFLSRISVPGRFFAGATEPLSASAAMFPVAGILLALPAALVLLLAGMLGIPVFLSAVLSVAAMAVATGALHEDGLADVADGFFGGNDPVRRLEIMKDSSIGTYGALALGFSLLLRAGCIAALLETAGLFSTMLSLLAVAAASRAAMVWLWSSLPSARAGGVADRSGTPSRASTHSALAIGLAAAAVGVVPGIGPFGLIVAGVFTALAVAGFRRLTEDKIGGQTGDTLGAAQQLAEISLLVGLVIAL